jgi:galactokinase
MPGDALHRLRDELPDDPEVIWRAPGRANLIGEHTDYNAGLVLPVALELATFVGGRRAARVRLRSLDAGGQADVDPVTGEGPARGWGAYVTGVVKALKDEGVAVGGFDGIVSSDVPLGAGLSSSAALELAVARAVAAEPVEPEALAEICRRAENVYVGMRCGIMDQMASSAAREGHALLIDCRDDAIEHVPVPGGLVFLLMDSGVSRELAGSAYNERRAEAERAAEALGVASLRDATLEMVESSHLGYPLRRRARHVVTENERVAATVRALRRGATEELPALFEASHRSLAEDYEVSTPELDELVHIASEVEGIVASRATGAGFGGCTVNVVEADAAEEAARKLAGRYASARGIEPRWWISGAAGGAGRVDA